MTAGPPPTAFDVSLLADRPEFVEPLATLRFREWGPEPGRERLADYVAVTAAEAGRVGLPVTLVAARAGVLLGGVGLAADDLVERPGRGPWIVGTVVAPAHRRAGVGATLLDRLSRHAAGLGARQVRVATGGAAVAFYAACGWTVEETVRTGDGADATVLVRVL